MEKFQPYPGRKILKKPQHYIILSLINEKTQNLEKIPGLLNLLKSKAKVVQSVQQTD